MPLFWKPERFLLDNQLQPHQLVESRVLCRAFLVTGISSKEEGYHTHFDRTIAFVEVSQSAE
jgi:hypothetical protein